MNSFEMPQFETVGELHEIVRAIKEKTLASYELNSAWNDAVYEWNAELKQQLRDTYGSTQLLQQIPAWQVMVGGSIEEPVDVTEEQVAFVHASIQKFLDAFTRTYGL